MSGNQKVTVLTTNGRRQNVPITPNTTLLQILEQVCKKYEFQSNEHGLKHHNKIQDLSLTFRFSGLPNNCLLEMFETENPREDDNDVVLCVQLENGERFQGDFKSNQTIEYVLNDLCKTEFEAMENPIVFYMRQEIYGSSLKITTLKTLGITSGRAIVRLLNRKPEDLKTQANVYVPPTVKPVETKENEEYQKKSQKSESKGSLEINVSEIVKSLKAEDDKNQISQLENIVDEKRIQEENHEDDEKKKDTKPTYEWNESCGRSMIEKEDNTLLFSNSDDMETDINEPIVYELGERNAVVFSLESAQKVPDEIPDSFFELTTNDLKLLLRDLRKEVSGNDEAPLLTAKLRELEESKKILRKMEQYKHCVIRIQFPDRLVLQGTFRPTENVSDVQSFIKKYLKNPDINFHLFTIPPKKILSENDTLLEADCVPTSILHFGVENNDEQEESFLLDELHSQLTSLDGALLSATKSRGLLPQSGTKVDEVDVIVSSSSSSPSKGAVPKKPKSDDFKESKITSSNKDDKIPKWFKPIKK